MIILRSLLFNFCFFGWSLLASVIFIPLFIASPRTAQLTGWPWATVTLFMARVICGIKYEIRGREYITDGPVIYAAKHQSAWDTMIFLVLFKNPAYVLKRELLRIPGWGWYLWRMKMIAIDRSGKASSLKDLIRQSREALAENRPIVLFPEGTRMRPGAPPDYQPGIIALYNQLGVPVIPVALNSGAFWGKNAFNKYPGTIVMEFLPPMAPGMAKGTFLPALQSEIEEASKRLLDEALGIRD